MPINYKDAAIPTSFATCSIGHKESHTLPVKLRAIASAGFDGIELSMPDILSYGKELHGREPDQADYDALCAVATNIRFLCESLGLKVLMLQPFANFEGYPRDSAERADAFERARGWMRVARAAGTDMLQIGSSDAPPDKMTVQSKEDLARDLAELADIFDSEGGEGGMRICYENWCWATRAPHWRDVWEIVKMADRRNLGLCLDTFQSAGGEWGDPTTESGFLEEGGSLMSAAQVQSRWEDSLRDLAATVPAEKIFLLQISDAYKMAPPLEGKPNEEGLRPRGQWSHDYRPLPYDGGYLPVKDFLKAVLETGFRGWLSVEVFDGKGPEKYGDDLGGYSKKAMESLQRLLRE
ncbi:3-dehydroshikimate dehydratase [Xylariaceae sp. FL0594]|nr:3-dehydroshikimate dehydratase [Xylariaceae sp. FL0594]